MAGSRPLTKSEERLLVRRIRRVNARDRALISAQLFLGFRISEIIALRVGHVWHHGQVRARVALPPRFLKGHYGRTRTIPIGPELHRALASYLKRREADGSLRPELPLFLSRCHGPAGAPKTITRSMAEKIIKTQLRLISDDPQALSTHSLRKTFAVRLYEASGHDLLLVRDGLGHSSVAVTQVYLPIAHSKLEAMVLRGDWTRRVQRRFSRPGRKSGPVTPLPLPAAPDVAA